MGSGSLLLIGTNGPEDKFLYGNPKKTYFKNVFVKARNFALEYAKIPEANSNIDFGRTFKVSVPHSGDLLAGIYLDFTLSDLVRSGTYDLGPTPLTPTTLPQFSSYVNGIGYNILKEVKLYIGGNHIQTLSGELIYIINELHSGHNKSETFKHLAKFGAPPLFIIKTSNTSSVSCQLQLPFFFSKDPGQYLPLCALTNSKIELEITLRSFEECVVQSFSSGGGKGLDGTGSVLDIGVLYNEKLKPGTIDSFDIITQKLFLDPEDQKLFRICPKLDYMIELYHIGDEEKILNPSQDNTYSFDLQSRHPTKYVVWVLQRKDIYDAHMYDNYTHDFTFQESEKDNDRYKYDTNSHLLTEVDILLDNIKVINGINPIFISKTQMYEKFSGPAGLQPIYIYNFSLEPDSNQPTGTINMSSFSKKTFQIKLCDENNYTSSVDDVKSDILFRHYTCYFNILVISDGMAGLMYN